MKGWRNIFWALAAVVALAAPAFAQGGGASSTGSISGEIKDAQGGVLPGVTVTATSPAQIGALTAVTERSRHLPLPRPCRRANTGWRSSSPVSRTACATAFASRSASTRRSTSS